MQPAGTRGWHGAWFVDAGPRWSCGTTHLTSLSVLLGRPRMEIIHRNADAAGRLALAAARWVSLRWKIDNKSQRL
jgi:hypothetical protein